MSTQPEARPPAPPRAAEQDAPLPPGLAETRALSRVFHESGLFPDIKSQAQAMVKILLGQEIGLQPLEAMMNIDIVQGRIRFSAQLMAKIIKRDAERGGYDYRLVGLDNERCEVRFYHRGQPLEPTSVFTIQDAAKARLGGKDVYQAYPRNMLFARALTNGARFHCPHLFGPATSVAGVPTDMDDETQLAIATPAPPTMHQVEAEAERNTAVTSPPRAASPRYHTRPEESPAAEPETEPSPTEAPEEGGEIPADIATVLHNIAAGIAQMPPAEWTAKQKQDNIRSTRAMLARRAGLSPESFDALLRAIQTALAGQKDQEGDGNIEAAVDCRALAYLNINAEYARDFQALADWWRLNREPKGEQAESRRPPLASEAPTATV